MENPMNKWMIWGYHYFWKHPYMYLINIYYIQYRSKCRLIICWFGVGLVERQLEAGWCSHFGFEWFHFTPAFCQAHSIKTLLSTCQEWQSNKLYTVCHCMPARIRTCQRIGKCSDESAAHMCQEILEQFVCCRNSVSVASSKRHSLKPWWLAVEGISQYPLGKSISKTMFFLDLLILILAKPKKQRSKLFDLPKNILWKPRDDGCFGRKISWDATM